MPAGAIFLTNEQARTRRRNEASLTRRDPLAEDRTDGELVHAARDGDTAAFDALFYRHRDGIYRLAVAITHDPCAGEEIVVDTFARAYRALLRLEPDDSLRPWLYRVAVNLSYDRKPRKGLAFSSFEESAAESFATDERSPSLLAEQAELRRVVLASIDALGPKQRVVVVLHYLNELNLAEIAQIVDCPVGTVKSRLHYALGQLRVRLRAAGALGTEPWGRAGATGSRMKVLPRAVPR